MGSRPRDKTVKALKQRLTFSWLMAAFALAFVAGSLISGSIFSHSHSMSRSIGSFDQASSPGAYWAALMIALGIAAYFAYDIVDAHSRLKEARRREVE
jgi:hypothetical protein